MEMWKFNFAQTGLPILTLYCWSKTYIISPLRSEQHVHVNSVTVPSDCPSSKYI